MTRGLADAGVAAEVAGTGATVRDEAGAGGIAADDPEAGGAALEDAGAGAGLGTVLEIVVITGCSQSPVML